MGLILKLKPLLITIKERLIFTRWEVGQDGPQNVRVDKIIDNDMRKRRCVSISLSQGVPQSPTFVSIKSDIIADFCEVEHHSLSTVIGS
jgi:hypothetical protein